MPAAAPPEADLLVAFLNTVDLDSGRDELADADGWVRWAAAQDLPAAGDHGRALALREALRGAAAGDAAPDVTVAVEVGVIDGGPAASAPDACGAIALAALRLVATGEWPRLKLCASPTCRWAFHDASRNRSRAWCSMDVCGNRAKARTFRSRARAQSD